MEEEQRNWCGGRGENEKEGWRKRRDIGDSKEEKFGKQGKQ